MESYGELLPGIALDSVVEKASELERILRGCKIAAAHDKLSTPPLEEGRGHTSSKVNTSDQLPSSSEVDGGSAAGLNTHWRQLSTYIVGLEKEIQYYKQLVDANQRTAVGHASAQERGPRSLQPLAHQSRPGPGHVNTHKSETIFAADNEFWTKLLESQ